MEGEADGETPRPRATPVTFFLIAVNVLVFGAMIAKGVPSFAPTVEQLRAWGGSYGPITVTSTDPARHAQWWRIISAAFVHGGFPHLAINMLAFFGIGRAMERIVGPVSLLWTYLTCGAAGALASVYWKPLTTSVGASGAIFGVAACLLVLVMRRRVAVTSPMLSRLTSNVLVFLAMSFALGLSSTGVDNAAHGGGALCGVALAFLVPPIEGRKRRIVVSRMVAVVVPLAAAGVVDARHVARVPGVRAERFYHEAFALANGHEAFAEPNGRRLDEAIAKMGEAIDAMPDSSAPWVARGAWQEASGRNALAERDYDAAIARTPEHSLARERRCVVRAERNDVAGAHEDCSVAVRVAPDSASARMARARLWLGDQNWNSAVTDLTEAIRLDPGLTGAYRARAAAELALGQKDLSLRDIEHVAGIEPVRADVLVSWIQLLVDNGDVKRALSVAETAVAKFPREPRVLLARASARGASGDFAAAKDDARAAVLLAPELSVARNAHAWYLRLSGDPVAAIAEATGAMQLAPQSGAVADTRCWARFEAGDVKGATGDCVRALALDPALKPTVGLLAYMRGDYEAAARSWEAAALESNAEAAELAPWIQKARAQLKGAAEKNLDVTNGQNRGLSLGDGGVGKP